MSGPAPSHSRLSQMAPSQDHGGYSAFNEVSPDGFAELIAAIEAGPGFAHCEGLAGVGRGEPLVVG